ncbi:hypothetical protein PR048_014805 [Dryococelus australis]|uniref:Uncharacterized protein n=1 Tax=Dryococelus australis TaxID=614101 RepID=A0ABQ9HFM3_9NEOP|nr:hypothetical protein PR048_014805 [Dryococelus australis]
MIQWFTDSNIFRFCNKVRKLSICGSMILNTITLTFLGRVTSAPVAITLIMVSVLLESIIFMSLNLNCLDLTPQYSGIVIGMLHTLSALAGIISPTLSGYIIRNKVIAGTFLGTNVYPLNISLCAAFVEQRISIGFYSSSHTPRSMSATTNAIAVVIRAQSSRNSRCSVVCAASFTKRSSKESRAVMSGTLVDRRPAHLYGSRDKAGGCVLLTSDTSLYFHYDHRTARTITLKADSHQSKLGSIPGGETPGFSYVGIVLDDANGRRVFSGISRFSRPFITALLHTYLASPSSALKISMRFLDTILRLSRNKDGVVVRVVVADSQPVVDGVRGLVWDLHSGGSGVRRAGLGQHTTLGQRRRLFVASGAALKHKYAGNLGMRLFSGVYSTVPEIHAQRDFSMTFKECLSAHSVRIDNLALDMVANVCRERKQSKGQTEKFRPQKSTVNQQMSLLVFARGTHDGRTMPLFGGFSLGSLISLALVFRSSSCYTLNAFRYLVKSRPNLITPLAQGCTNWFLLRALRMYSSEQASAYLATLHHTPLTMRPNNYLTGLRHWFQVSLQRSLDKVIDGNNAVRDPSGEVDGAFDTMPKEADGPVEAILEDVDGDTAVGGLSEEVNCDTTVVMPLEEVDGTTGTTPEEVVGFVGITPEEVAGTAIATISSRVSEDIADGKYQQGVAYEAVSRRPAQQELASLQRDRAKELTSSSTRYRQWCDVHREGDGEMRRAVEMTHCHGYLLSRPV